MRGKKGRGEIKMRTKGNGGKGRELEHSDLNSTCGSTLR